MKSVFYVAKDVDLAVKFIKANTNWKHVTRFSFRNGGENIIVISDFMRIRGRKVDGVYVDYSFNEINDRVRLDFINRFNDLNLTPEKINKIDDDFRAQVDKGE